MLFTVYTLLEFSFPQPVQVTKFPRVCSWTFQIINKDNIKFQKIETCFIFLLVANVCKNDCVYFSIYMYNLLSLLTLIKIPHRMLNYLGTNFFSVFTLKSSTLKVTNNQIATTK